MARINLLAIITFKENGDMVFPVGKEVSKGERPTEPLRDGRPVKDSTVV